MNNPKCPYCGDEMKLSAGCGGLIEGRYWYRCDNCNALAPDANSPEAAYAAAMKRDREKGEWIGFAEFEQCSVCEATHLKEIQTVYGKAIWVKSNFCPNCGADMRKEKDE